MPGLGASSRLPLSVSIWTGSDGARPKWAHELRPQAGSTFRARASLLPRHPYSWGPHDPSVLQGRLPFSSPVSPSASSWPGTSVEPAAACDGCGLALRNENCAGVLIMYKAGRCYPGENSLLTALLREAAWLVASFHRVKRARKAQ